MLKVLLHLATATAILLCPVLCAVGMANASGSCCGLEKIEPATATSAAPAPTATHPCCHENGEQERSEPAGESPQPKGSDCQCLCGGAVLAQTNHAPAGGDLVATLAVVEVPAAESLLQLTRSEIDTAPPAYTLSGRMIRAWIMSLRN